MINLDYITKNNIKRHKPKLGQKVHDHPCRIIIIEDFEFGKTNILFNLIN